MTIQRLFLICVALFVAQLVSAANATFDDPAPLVAGDNSIPVSGIRATGYYVYTATTDELVTITIPVTEASLYVSRTPQENPIESEIKLMTRKFIDNGYVRFMFHAPKNETLYIKATFIAWDLPEGTSAVTMTMSAEAFTYQEARTCSDAIDLNTGKDFYYLPLAFDENMTAEPVYLSFTATQSGYLYLNFEPSVTEIRYATDCAGEFVPLKHSYITEGSQTVGASAHIEIMQGDHFVFCITGFNPALVRIEEVDPEPGTMCDFPIDIEPGKVSLPAAAGNYYWRIHCKERGYIEVNSDLSLPGGFVEVMYDCAGTNSFTILDELSLRRFVYDNMDYLIHISKPTDTPEGASFEVKVGPELPCDCFDTATLVTPGETVSTLPYAGTYYYKVHSPDLIGSELVLDTKVEPGDERTRVNLYKVDDDFNTVARGLDLRYTVEPNTDYVIKYTVFDNRLSLPFEVRFEGGHSAVKEITGSSELIHTVDGGVVVTCPGKATVFDIAGRIVSYMESDADKYFALSPGCYVVFVNGMSVRKVMVR